MTAQEENYVRDVLNFFYPFDLIQDVTQELGDLAASMLKAALQASKAMDMVPRPTYSPPGVGWLVLQGVQIFWRSLGRQRIYEAVRVDVARNFRSAFLIAKQISG